ncbi:SH3 domain-containing protein [Roseococcus sp.]|uniref:SH3 domain-containing protein n=1 Tax=Roseococcus sp. TaxID=2109646 RepID=UPI003BAA3E86
MAVPAGLAVAQPRADKTSAVAVRLSSGATATSFNGRVRGNESVDYRLNAQAGQAMTVRFRPGNGSVEYVVLAPGGDTPIHNSRTAGNEFTGTVQASGTHIVRVFLARGPARRANEASFTIAFGLDGHGARANDALPPARPDSTLRAPDARVVGGLARGDVLTVRSGPSYSARTLLRFPEGAVLRSFGCQDVAGASWCSVGPADAQRPSGWASARYLREVAAPTAAPAAGRDSRVPGTPFQATGQVECRLQGQAPVTCPFGVRRHGPGTATVEITLPNGQRRSLVFRSGQVSTEGREPVVASREGDNMVVTVDGNERYVIPDLVIRGE